MLGKLRIKFIAIIMASVAAVLVVVFSAICMTEYQRTMATVEEAMENAINRASEGMMGLSGQSQASMSSDSSDYASWSSGGFPREGLDSSDASPKFEDNEMSPGEAWDDDIRGPRIGGEGRGERSIVPVAVYTVQQETDLQIVSSFTTAAIDDSVLVSVSPRVIQAADGSGTLDDVGLHYQKRTTDKATYIAFADVSSTSSWQSLALMLAVAAVVVLAVFFLISLVLSKWALRPVKEAWDSQRQFVADASHELKTPLTVVLANTSILLKHPEKSIAEQSQWVESTQIEAQNMQGLVNEMLELAQVESRTNVQHEPLDFSDLVDVEVLQFESVAFERGCILEDDVSKGISIDGDALRLRKMTSTLIENALKYVDAGGTVGVRLSSDGKTAVLTIRNTGSVISPEDLPHIFDRFYRTDKARTSGTGGYGLGLAIAREIAGEHDGDITCTSNATEGTTFTVTLPVIP